MARYPGARWRPIPEDRTEPPIVPTQIILHSAVDAPGPTDLWPYFAREDVNVESHFWLRLDGTLDQFIDTERQADANYRANVRAISVETEDDGDTERRLWTPEQMRSLEDLIVWCHRTHGIPITTCLAWDRPGVGWHSMWGSPSPWTPVGRSCPGRERIRQIPELLMRARASSGSPRPTIPQTPAPVADDDPVEDTMFIVAEGHGIYQLTGPVIVGLTLEQYAVARAKSERTPVVYMGRAQADVAIPAHLKAMARAVG